MKSSPPADRQVLYLQNAGMVTAWIMSFVAKYRAKKDDKMNTDGTIVGLQVTNLFLITCRQEKIIHFRSLWSPRNLIDTPYKDIRSAIHNVITPKERVVTAEKAKFLSVIQSVPEFQSARYSRSQGKSTLLWLRKLKTVANTKEELVKGKLISISVLRDLEY